MRKRLLACLVACLSLLLAGCESRNALGVETNSRNSQTQVGSQAAGANAFPHGRRVPNLTGSERALYQEVAADFQKSKNDPAIFDVSSSLPVRLDADTQSLLAHQRTATQFEILNRGNDIRQSMNTRALPLDVSLLEGTVKDGTIDGPFDAVIRYETVTTYSGGTQNVVMMMRVKGTMSEGALEGPFTVARRMESSISGGAPLTIWTVGGLTFAANQQTGTAIIYSEMSDFNVTTVIRTLANGAHKMQSYIGNQLNTVSMTHQDKLYGAYRIYTDGRPATPVYYWDGVPVQGANFVNTPEGKPLATVTGIGMNHPREMSGPFQVRDVHYPSPAATAGLLPGDIVISINGQRLTSAHNTAAIERMLAGAQGGDVVLGVDRAGLREPQDIRITRGPFQVLVPGP